MVTFFVNLSCLLLNLQYIFLICINRYLNLVYNRLKSMMGHSDIDNSEMLESESFPFCIVVYPYPVDIPLSHVPYTLSLIDIRMDFSFDNRFGGLPQVRSACWCHFRDMFRPTLLIPFLP